MRVLLISANGADVSAGGAERYIADLGKGLRRRGHDVMLLAAAPPRDDRLGARTAILHKQDWRDSVVRRIANRLGDFHAEPSTRLQHWIEAAEADIVHTSTLPGITTAVWEVCRSLGVPVVHTLHDYYLLCARASLSKRDGSSCAPNPLVCGIRSRRLLRHAGAVSQLIGVSRFILARHEGLFPRAQANVVRLPLGADVEARKPAGQPPRSVGYIGRLEREKGVHLLVAAADALRERGISLRVAGDGALRELVERAARAGALEYAGVVGGAAKTRFIERCDFGILPSLWLEPGGPPYAPLEWLALGRPVLVSNRGGLAETAELFEAAAAFEPTLEGLLAAVDELRTGPTFEVALASLAGLDAGTAQEKWLDQHERIYRTAA